MKDSEIPQVLREDTTNGIDKYICKVIQMDCRVLVAFVMSVLEAAI